MDFQALRETLEPWLGNRYLQAAGILLLSVVIAKLADVVITRFIRRFTSRTKTEADDQIVETLHRPIFVTMLVVGLITALRLLGLPEAVELNTERILQTLVILLWVGAVTKISTIVLGVLSRHKDRFEFIDQATLTLFDNIARVVAFGAAAYFVLLSWDLNITGWLASAGIVGIAVGFAAKDTIANLFGGVFILADKPYELGDFINLDSGERGEVTAIGLRTTRILTRDDLEITIPNAVIAQAKITNETGGRWAKERIRVKVGVAYGSDIDFVSATLVDIAIEHQEVCVSPEPRVRLRGFGASSLDFELLVWIEEPVLRGRILHELYSEIYKTFQKIGIEIPFPQRVVHLRPSERDSAPDSS